MNADEDEDSCLHVNTRVQEFSSTHMPVQRSNPSNVPSPSLLRRCPPQLGARLAYKAVAVVDGRAGQKYLSIYDGITEYRVGSTQRQAVAPNHNGGFFVCPSLEDSVSVEVPAQSALRVLSLAYPCSRCVSREERLDGNAAARMATLDAWDP